MPFLKEIKTEAGLLGIWKLSESSEKLEKDFDFSLNEKKEYSRIRWEKRKTEYLATRVLTHSLLGFKPSIIYEKSGKPVLHNSGLNISISHSAELVTVILSEKNVGIDVENTERNINRVAKRFLHKNELNHISKLGNPQAAKILYWSAKEAIFKCSDLVGIEFNQQIIIDSFEIKEEGSFTGTINNDVPYSLWYFFLENNVIVFCVEVVTS